MDTQKLLLEYTQMAIETMMSDAQIPFSTSSVFFDPRKKFVGWMHEFAVGHVVVDCGAGLGHTTLALQNHGVRAIAVDLFPSPDAVVENITPMNAVLFPFSDAFIAMICRPCRGDWIHATIIAAVESGAKCVYVGKESHYAADLAPLPYEVVKVMEQAGAAGESVWTISKRVENDEIH